MAQAVGGPHKGPGPRCQFLENQKANVPTSPRWIWAKNMGLGTFGFINWQKFLPSGLKIQADILTRRDLSESGLQKFRWIGRKLDPVEK